MKRQTASVAVRCSIGSYTWFRRTEDPNEEVNNAAEVTDTIGKGESNTKKGRCNLEW